MLRILKIFVPIVVLGLMAGLLPARLLLAQPPAPCAFWGDATATGTSVPSGLTITARVDGVSDDLATSTTGSGTYGQEQAFYVLGDDPSTEAKDGAVAGDTVHFYLGDVKADQTGTWQSGGNIELDLTFPSLPTPTPTPTATPGGGGVVPGPGGTSTPTPAPPPAVFPDIQVISVSVNPTEASAGTPITITTEISNLGSGFGTYEFAVLVNGVQETLLQGILDPFASETRETTVTKDAPGDYTVEVGEQTASFTLTPLPTADIHVISVTANPTEAAPGTSITITVEISNYGLAAGDYEFPVLVNGVQEALLQGSLDAGASETRQVTVTKEAAGDYIVDVDGQTASFTLMAPTPTPSPTATPTPTLRPGETPLPTATPTPTPTLRPGETPRPTATPTPIPTPTTALTPTRAPTPTITPTPAPVRVGNFEFSDLVVSPRTVGSGETVRVRVTVENLGGATGTYTADLLINGSREATLSGELAAGDSDILLFQVSRDRPGTYSISIVGLISNFIVVAPVEIELPTDTTINADTTTATDEDGNPLTLTDDTVSSDVVDGQLVITIPVQLAQGKGLDSFSDATSGIVVEDGTIEMPIKDAEGNVTMTLIAETDGFTGTGDTATANVTKLTLVTEEQEIDLSSDDPNVGTMAFSIEAELNTLPEGAKLTFTPKKTLSPDALAGFELVARGDGLTVNDVGAAIEITRENLENVTDVGTVTITMKVGRAWVEAQGGVDNIRMARLADDGTREWLETTYIGDDDQGRMIFEAISPNGFSIFALMGLAPLSADFQISQLSVTPAVVAPGVATQISAVVTNTGNTSGTYNVILSVNGKVEDTQTVTLGPGQSTTVTFYVARDAEGTYTFKLEQLSGNFQVSTAPIPTPTPTPAVAPTPTPTPTPTPPEPAAGFPIIIVIVVVVVLVGGGAAYYFLVFRRGIPPGDAFRSALASLRRVRDSLITRGKTPPDGGSDSGAEGTSDQEEKGDTEEEEEDDSQPTT